MLDKGKKVKLKTETKNIFLTNIMSNIRTLK